MRKMLMRICGVVFIGVLVLVCAGCSGITASTHAYLGIPKYPPIDPNKVQILREEPKQPIDRLGEIILGAEGGVNRDALEKELKRRAAELGANAVIVVYDKTHVFPVVYVDWYWGPSGVSSETHRDIVALAVRYK
jgi:hypothetical protein